MLACRALCALAFAVCLAAGDEVVQLDQDSALVGGNKVQRNAPGVGGWGGTCTCPNGQKYQVGDNNDSCKSLACVGGQSGKCGSNNPGGAHVKVSCAPAAKKVGCTKADVDRAFKADSAAAASLKAMPKPASASTSVEKAAKTTAAKLKALKANPACKKILEARSAASKVKERGEKAKKSEVAAKKSNQLSANERRVKAHEKGSKNQMAMAVKRQRERALKSGGEQGLVRELVGKRQKREFQAMGNLRARLRADHVKRMKDMAKLFKEKNKKQAAELQAKLLAMRAEQSKRNEKIMRLAHEEGQKASLGPAARKETRVKKAKRMLKRQQKRNSKRIAKDKLLMQRKKEIADVGKDLKKIKEKKAMKFMKRVAAGGEKQTARAGKDMAKSMAAKAKKPTSVDVSKITTASRSKEDVAFAKALAKSKKVNKKLKKEAGKARL